MEYTAQLFKCVFGSHLYGTANEKSDHDFKAIHKADLRSILLGKDKDNITQATNKKTRNSSEDVDFESKELRTFINDCLTGQTYALDLLFVPDSLVMNTSNTWKDILSKKDKLITNNVTPFVGYCKGQAIKYSKKGATVKELDNLLRLIKGNNFKFVKDLTGHFQFEQGDTVKVKPSNGEMYLEVGNSSYPFNRTMDLVTKSIQAKFDEYGERALSAVVDGADLKAFYHAYRICWELEELLTNGFLKFPSEKVQTLRDIRAGKFTRDNLEKKLTDEIERVLEIPNTLPEPDRAYWDDWLTEEYLGCK